MLAEEISSELAPAFEPVYRTTTCSPNVPPEMETSDVPVESDTPNLPVTDVSVSVTFLVIEVCHVAGDRPACRFHAVGAPAAVDPHVPVDRQAIEGHAVVARAKHHGDAVGVVEDHRAGPPLIVVAPSPELIRACPADSPD